MDCCHRKEMTMYYGSRNKGTINFAAGDQEKNVMGQVMFRGGSPKGCQLPTEEPVAKVSGVKSKTDKAWEMCCAWRTSDWPVHRGDSWWRAGGLSVKNCVRLRALANGFFFVCLFAYFYILLQK